MGKKAKKADTGKNQSKKAKQGNKAKQSKQSKGAGSSKSRSFDHTSSSKKKKQHRSSGTTRGNQQQASLSWKPRIALKGHWSDELQRWVYPFEVPWEELSKDEHAAAIHLHNLEGPVVSKLHVKVWWQERLQKWRNKRLPDPLGFGADPLKYSLYAPSRKLCIAQARLGLLWQEAQLAGFGLLHAAFKPLLKSVCISPECENEQDWALFTSPGQSRRRAIDADACCLCYWEVRCPQVELWGFCEWGDHCPFSLSAEEVSCHPAVSLFTSAHRRAASHWMPSFESRFGNMAVTALKNPHLLACNAFWPKSCVVVAVHAAEAAPILELSVRQATPLGPGRSGLVEKRYLVLPAACSWEVSEAVLMSQLPARDVLQPPAALKRIAGSTWECLKLRLGALHDRLSFLGLTAGHTSIDLKNTKIECIREETVDERECEDLEDNDSEDEDWDEQDSFDLVKALKAILQSRSQVPCPKREETVSTAVLAQHMKWYAWQAWEPAQPWAGASAGEWSQAAGQFFGVLTRPVCGKPKQFAQQVSGISVWNHKGNAYLYPTPVYCFLNRFSEGDIKWAFRQLETAEGVLHEGSDLETEQEDHKESDEESETERPGSTMGKRTNINDVEKDIDPSVHNEASEIEDVQIADDVEYLHKEVTMTDSHRISFGLSMGWTRLDLLPQFAMQRVFHFFSWADISATQTCTTLFLRLVLRWQHGQWVRERSADCNTTRMFASTLMARHSLQERGGTWLSMRRRRAKRNADQHSKSPQCKSARASSVPADCSSRWSGEVGRQHASVAGETSVEYAKSPSVMGLSDRFGELALEPHSLQHLIRRIGFVLDMPAYFVDGDSTQLLLWQMCWLLQSFDLWNLMGASEGYRRRLVRLGLHKSLLAVLGHLLEMPMDESEQAVEHVLRVLAKMAFVHSRRNTQQSRMGPRILLTTDITKLLFKFTQRFASNELIAVWVLRFLAAVVYNCDESKSVFNELGGIDILVSILVKHDTEEEVLLAGMSALANLTFLHEKRGSERAFEYVPPTMGSTYRLCERLFRYTDHIDPEIVVVKTYQATTAPKSRDSKGTTRKSALPPEVRVSVIYARPKDGHDPKGKWNVRHMHVLVRTAILDGDLLCLELERAAARYVPVRSLKGYVAVLFYSSQRECKILQRSLHRLQRRLGGLYCCQRVAKPHSTHRARDGRGLEFWLLWSSWDCNLLADMPLLDGTSHEGACFHALQQVSVVLWRLKRMAQGVLDNFTATRDNAAIDDIEVGSNHQEALQQMDAELEEATNHCALCQSDVAHIRHLLRESSRGMWLNVLLILEPKYEVVAVGDIRFLHGGISSRFLHGRHAGQPITQLVEDLRSRRTKPDELNIELVKWHGKYRTLRHRRVWALKQWAAEIEETSSSIQTFSARVLPLVADVKDLDGRAVVRKFFSAYSTENDGTSVKIRGTLPGVTSARDVIVQRPLATPYQHVRNGQEHHGAANFRADGNRSTSVENHCNSFGGGCGGGCGGGRGGGRGGDARSPKAGLLHYVPAHVASNTPATNLHGLPSTRVVPTPVFPTHPFMRPTLPGHSVELRPNFGCHWNMQMSPMLGPPENLARLPPHFLSSQPSSNPPTRSYPPPPPSVPPFFLPHSSSLVHSSSDLLHPTSIPVLPPHALTGLGSHAHVSIPLPSMPMNQTCSRPELCPMTAGDHMAALLLKVPQHEHRQIIGEALFEKVRTREPGLAKRLTGMCLENDNAILLDVLQDDSKMWQMVDQALLTLIMSRRDVPGARALIFHMSADSRQRIIGMHLHKYVSGFRPGQASKVTGMLLQLEIDHVAELLVSEAKLQTKIEEALALLARTNHSQPAPPTE